MNERCLSPIHSVANSSYPLAQEHNSPVLTTPKWMLFFITTSRDLATRPRGKLRFVRVSHRDVDNEGEKSRNDLLENNLLS